LIATTTLGGEAGRTPAARSFLQTRESLLEEPLAPLADDLARGIEPGSNLLIGEAPCGVEHDSRTNYISIR
jgi:hypothetical protein